LFLTFHEKKKRMIVVRAVFFTGITGQAILQDPGGFPLEDIFSLLSGRIEIEIQVTALSQAIDSRALPADPGIIA
jgi:hypothetical protein